MIVHTDPQDDKPSLESKDLETAKEIPSKVTEEILAAEYEVLDVNKAVAIRCLRSKSVEEKLSSLSDDNCIKKTVENHSDLIPNVYEGGLKIWECSVDLVEHLCETKVPLKGLSVLELGCGAGLPGIYALQQQAHHVCFQDFNEEVISHLTIPNVSLNVDSETMSQKCRFLSGGWSQTGSDLIPSERYDIILTAETIYNTESVPSLYKLMRRGLKPGGTMYPFGR
ncbi:putative histidine protein methyltransferase 1-like [Apostichopus japonicus]|uniref:protein-histidine N-methyltransferase n=1 Tax=Stichopus japonicus TaxID=307972 RepID=A0A2G8JPP9_STIJA|nr:putative histidine protein methyltransferase 1-like [Apostichopus japonicus]